MMEHEIEPTPGLPGRLPPGERIVWQGAPDWQVLARTAFHTRLIGGYFAALTGWALAGALYAGVDTPGDLVGTAMTAIAGIIGIALLNLMAWGAARSTIYTLTDRRLVLRIGIAVSKCINLPLGMITSVDLAHGAADSGDIALKLGGTPKLGFLALWPHARAWRITAPQPMLRAVPDAAHVATLIAQGCVAVHGQGHANAVETPTTAPAFAEALAA